MSADITRQSENVTDSIRKKTSRLRFCNWQTVVTAIVQTKLYVRWSLQGTFTTDLLTCMTCALYNDNDEHDDDDDLLIGRVW